MPLEPLATSSDVTSRLGRALTEGETARLDSLISDASAKLRSYTGGQEITQRTSIDRVRIEWHSDGEIPLPQQPVSGVSSVVSFDSHVAVPFYWDGLKLWGWGAFPNSNVEGPLFLNRRRRGLVVDVTYTHGFEDTPPDVMAVLCQVILRALGAPPDQSGISQESYAGYSYSLGSAAASGPLGLLQGEIDVLAAYGPQPARPIRSNLR